MSNIGHFTDSRYDYRCISNCELPCVIIVKLNFQYRPPLLESYIKWLTSGTLWSPNIDLRTAIALATMTSSGKLSNLTASSPNKKINYK